MDQPIVEFADWEQALRETVPADLREGYREAVVKFRYWLREMGKPATAESFREHLAWKKSDLPPEKFERRAIETPRPGPGAALLRQTAVGLNFIDVYHRSGL